MAERWISFDCFGTLVDWNGGFRAILEPVAGSRTDELVRAYHRHERIVEQGRFLKYREVMRIALEQAAGELDITLAPGQSTALAHRWVQLPVFEDTNPSLRQLHADRWRIAVLTNCDDDLFTLTRTQLGEPIDLVVTAEQVHSYKPALGHFMRFREAIGPQAEWIHAANSWFHDIAPARTLGIPRIWVNRDQTGDDPSAATAVIPDLRALAQTLAAIKGR